MTPEQKEAFEQGRSVGRVQREQAITESVEDVGAGISALLVAFFFQWGAASFIDWGFNWPLPFWLRFFLFLGAALGLAFLRMTDQKKGGTR